jgi:hypothetical protein
MCIPNQKNDCLALEMCRNVILKKIVENPIVDFDKNTPTITATSTPSVTNDIAVLFFSPPFPTMIASATSQL